MPFPSSTTTAHNIIKDQRSECAVGRGNIVSRSHGLAIFYSILALLFLLSQATAVVAAPSATSRVQFNIPRQTADDSLPAFGQQANVTVVYPFEDASQHHTNRLYGNYTLKEGIHLLLKGSGLYAEFSEDNHLIISSDVVKGESMMKTKKHILAATIGYFMAGGVGAADVVDSEWDELNWLLEEVVVTAQRREASMQDVPISISAFSGERLQQSGVGNTFDLEMVTPGLSIGSDVILGNVFIRGVGSTTLAGPGTDPSTSTYIDGVYQSRTLSAVIDMLDVDRVEVLKGPQGTLYGRNSTGGALKYISKKPGNEFGGNLKAEAGSYNNIKLSAAIDTPLIEDKLLLRTALLKHDRDGFTEVINHSGPDNDREDLLAGRFSLQYIINDDVDVILHATAVSDDGGGPAFKQLIDPDHEVFSTALVISDPRKTLSDVGPTEISIKTRAIDATVNWELDWARLTSITAYDDISTDPYVLDNDATEVAGIRNGRAAVGDEEALDGLFIEAETFTQEITLASQGEGRLDWTIGAFYFEGENLWDTGVDLAFIPFFADILAINKTTAYAGFADLTYALTDKLHLNAGIRYSHETKEDSQRPQHNGVIGEFVDQEESWSDWTPKIGLSYSFSDDVMVYLSASEGFKSGAFDLGSGTIVDPEFVTAYEIGAKTMLLDSRLRLNVSAFDYDYKDMQVLAYNSDLVASVTSNAAEASMQGVEISATALLSENFQIDIGLSWLDAEYSEFLQFDPASPSQFVSLAGNKLPQSPEFTASIGLAYNHQIDNIGNLQARLDYYYSAEKYFNEQNSDHAVQDDYELINARIGFQSQDGVWDVAVFGKNLTDELIYSLQVSVPFFYGVNGSVVQLAPPRTYGVSVAYNF